MSPIVHRTARGFTLIEVMVALVIIALLMAIVVPQVQAGRQRAYVSVMKSDLRNLAVEQESHFYDTSVYAPDVAVLTGRGFQSSEGVDVVVNEATASGWSATVSHVGTVVRCYLFVGSAAPVGAASDEGTITCG